MVKKLPGLTTSKIRLESRCDIESAQPGARTPSIMWTSPDRIASVRAVVSAM